MEFKAPAEVKIIFEEMVFESEKRRISPRENTSIGTVVPAMQLSNTTGRPAAGNPQKEQTLQQAHRTEYPAVPVFARGLLALNSHAYGRSH